MIGTQTLLLAEDSLTGGVKMLVMRLVLVLAGAIVGALLGHFGVKFAYRAFGWKQVHHPVKVVSRISGGLVVGFLVFLWCFSGGGGGWLGGGGGFWPFGAPFGSQGEGNTKGSDDGKDKGKNNGTDKKKADDGPEVLVIHMLGGERVKEQRFYVLDKHQPATLDDVKAALTKEKDKNKNLKKIEIRVYQDSVDTDNPAVTLLKEWVAGQDLTPAVATPAGNAP